MTDRVLVIGYGNPGRQDDALGPRLAELIATLGLEGVTVDSDYQLQVEDAVALADHDTVLFADAHVDCPGPFVFERVEPSGDRSFTTHSVDPGALLSMTREYFGTAPDAYLLGIRGYQFNGFEEDLSPEASRNLNAALRFIELVLRKRDFERAIKETSRAAHTAVER